MRKEGKKTKFYSLGKGVVFLTLLLAAVGSKMGGCGKTEEPKTPETAGIKILPKAAGKVEITSEGVTKTVESNGQYKGEIDTAVAGTDIKLDKAKTHKIKVKDGKEVSFKPTEDGTLVIAGDGKKDTDFRFFKGGKFKLKTIKITAAVPTGTQAYPTGALKVKVANAGGKAVVTELPASGGQLKSSAPVADAEVAINAKATVEALGANDAAIADKGNSSPGVMVDPFDEAFKAKAGKTEIATKPDLNIEVKVGPGATANDKLVVTEPAA